MNYLTVINLVYWFKKLFIYYLIIWRNSTLLLKDDSDDKDNPNP